MEHRATYSVPHDIQNLLPAWKEEVSERIKEGNHIDFYALSDF